MFKTITDIKDYQLKPVLSTSEFDDVKVKLFGKEYFFRDDYWMRHVHLKITDVCNGRCEFCIEKDSNIKTNKDNFMTNLKELLKQMHEQDTLHTISLTGGEPLLCPYLPEILAELAKYKDIFTTMNTNGRNIKKMKNAPQWLNISKHDFDDSEVFQLPNLTIEDISKIRENTGSQIRFQCVVIKDRLDTVPKIIDFIETYKLVVDDFSFRQLINDDYLQDNQPDLMELRQHLYDNAELHEQVFQDYYVYETWTYLGTKITLSFSDMKLLKNAEKTERNDILREIIVHPDGLISGDWTRTKKVIKE